MKKILLLFLFSLSFSFANTDYYIEDRAYLGCKAYPPGHCKSCQTDKQHIYQQAACSAFRICNWWNCMALIEVCGKLIDTNVKFMGKPALDYSELALEKELERRKEEEKNRRENPILSIKISQEYYSLQGQDKENKTQNDIGKDTQMKSLSYHKKELKIDIFA